MKKTLTNFKMEEMAQNLQPLLKQRGALGYAAARNFRTLTDALVEYRQFKDELIRKHGEETPEGQFAIQCGTPAFGPFMEELTVLGELTQEVDLRTVPVAEAIANLTGDEILGADWMLEE